MAAVINTNISSLNAQRNLTTSQSSLATSLQRLSSGLRINSAKDDAAGLAISERFTSQIKGLTQAARNANDGISLAQTAEGALGQVGDSLQRIRELAVQSANATNSSSDRAALQQEVAQLVSEITRIGDTTAFNGLKILDGSYTGQQYQIGANAGETINVSIGDSRASQLGATTLTGASGVRSDGTTLSDAITAAAVATGLVINGTDFGLDLANAKDMGNIVDIINTKASATGVTAARSSTNSVTSTFVAGAATGSTVTINGTGITLTDTDTITTAIAKYNEKSGQTGVTASQAMNADGTVNTGKIAFTSAGDMRFQVSDDTVMPDVALLADTAAAAGAVPAKTGAIYTAGITLSTKVGGTISVTGALAAAGTNAASALGLVSGTGLEATLQVSTLDISTVAGANKALAAADYALTQISGNRATLGAIQNRFTAVVANLSTASENFSASRSRIQDADFAAETANMTRGQILQQAGTAMLAQANSLPNGVLALLRG